MMMRIRRQATGFGSWSTGGGFCRYRCGRLLPLGSLRHMGNIQLGARFRLSDTSTSEEGTGFRELAFLSCGLH
jgi:hypothetical protein